MTLERESIERMRAGRDRYAPLVKQHNVFEHLSNSTRPWAPTQVAINCAEKDLGWVFSQKESELWRFSLPDLRSIRPTRMARLSRTSRTLHEAKWLRPFTPASAIPTSRIKPDLNRESDFVLADRK